MRIYLETATTGLWKWKENIDHPGEPHLLRLAMLRDDDLDRPLSTLIKPPPGVMIESGAAYAHGITQDVAERATVSAADVLEDLLPTILRADEIVAYGSGLHRKVLESCLLRAGMLVPEWNSQWRCAISEATNIVRAGLMSKNRWKHPQFTEAYRFFAGEEYRASCEPSRAGIDRVRAVARIYTAIQNRKEAA